MTISYGNFVKTLFNSLTNKNVKFIDFKQYLQSILFKRQLNELQQNSNHQQIDNVLLVKSVLKQFYHFWYHENVLQKNTLYSLQCVKKYNKRILFRFDDQMCLSFNIKSHQESLFFKIDETYLFRIIFHNNLLELKRDKDFFLHVIRKHLLQKKNIQYTLIYSSRKSLVYRGQFFSPVKYVKISG